MAQNVNGASLSAAPLPVVLSFIPSLLALFLPWIVLRPNRIADGVGYGVFTVHSGGTIFLLVLLGIVAASLGSVVAFDSRTGQSRIIRERYRSGMITATLIAWTVSVTVFPWYVVLQGTKSLLAAGEIGELGRINPSAGFLLMLLSGLIGWHELARLGGRRSRRILYPALAVSAIAIAVIIVQPQYRYLSYYAEYSVRAERFYGALIRHIALSGSALSLACIIGVPAGIGAYRFPRLRDAILDATSTIQTVPSLAMFGLLIAPLAALSRAFPLLREAGISGVGVTPALIALTLYALLPIVRNTVTGLLVVSPEVRESGRAMGMNRRQLFRMVEIPVALPVVLGGIRTAAVQAVGNTTVAGLIGAGGLGWFIFQGLGQAATDLVVLGVIPIVVLAVAVDRLFGLLQKISDRGKVVTEVAG